jgi:hypothetical protein
MATWAPLASVAWNVTSSTVAPFDLALVFVLMM